MANNKFLIEDLTQANASQLSGWTVLENNKKTYKYPVSNLSSDIENQAQAIPTGKAVYDYLNNSVINSTNQSSDINDWSDGRGNTLITQTKAVYDYINAISTSLSGDIDGSINKLVDGKAVYDYINAQQFLGPSDIDTDTPNLAAAINALLNQNHLVLYVRQDGITYSKLRSSDYSLIKTTNGYKIPIWANKSGYVNGLPKKLRDPSNTKYAAISSYIQYDAFEDGPIFFKTIGDAVAFSKKFKFLNGAEVFIDLLSDINSHLIIQISKDKKSIALCYAASTTIINSDNCKFTIQGVDLTSVKIEYAYDSSRKNDKYYIKSYTLTGYNQMRHIYVDLPSFYDARYHALLNGSNTIEFRYIIFDYIANNVVLSSNTYSNYCIYTLNSPNFTTFNSCAFIYSQYAIIGGNIEIGANSFMYCTNAIDIYGGYRSLINGNIEIIGCIAGIIARGGGNLTRLGDTQYGPLFCNGKIGINTNGLLDLITYADYYGYYDDYFISSANSLSNYDENSLIYHITDDNISDYFKFISKSEMYELISQPTFTTASCQYFALNPKYNHVIRAQYDNVDGSYHIVSCDKNPTSYKEYISKSTLDDESQFTTWTNIQTGGYVKNGYLRFSFIPHNDFITTNNGLYDNYGVDRTISSSGYRRLWQFIKQDPPLLCVWNAIGDVGSYITPVISRSLATKTPAELSACLASNGYGLSITLSSGRTEEDFSNLSSTSEYINRLIWGYSGGIFDITKQNISANGLSFRHACGIDYSDTEHKIDNYPSLISTYGLSGADSDKCQTMLNNANWLYATSITQL